MPLAGPALRTLRAHDGGETGKADATEQSYMNRMLRSLKKTKEKRKENDGGEPVEVHCYY